MEIAKDVVGNVLGGQRSKAVGIGRYRSKTVDIGENVIRRREERELILI